MKRSERSNGPDTALYKTTFTRVPDLRDRCYEDCLRALNLPSLLYRRRRMYLIQTFRIKKGIDDLEGSKSLLHNEYKRNPWPWYENHEANKQTVSPTGWWMTGNLCR